MEKKVNLKKIRSRMKGLLALGLAIFIALGVMPSMPVHAALSYYQYHFVRFEDKAGLYFETHNNSGGIIYEWRKAPSFNGNYYIDTDLNLTKEGEKDYLHYAAKDEMQNTVTLKFGEPQTEGRNAIIFGYVGPACDVNLILDGNLKMDSPIVDQSYHENTYAYVGGTIIQETGEYDLTLITDNEPWILDVVTVSKVNSIAFNKSKLNFKKGDSAQLLTIAPKLNLNRFDWESTDPNVATVDETGKVTPVNDGTATITATMKTNANIKASCTVTVGEQQGNSEDTNESENKKDPEPTINPTVEPAKSSEAASVNEEKAEQLNPKQKGTTLSKPKASKNKISLSWKKQTAKGIKGYEIQYSTDKGFKKDVTNTVTIKKAKTTKTTIKKLKSKTKYYVRIRTFSKKNGEKVYSKWSKIKSVKVK
ncbi:Ig-like domain-containing protein [Butyrivibrio sp. WCD3002]|uniref:Ig-like domain-containing protein n=1 Tax=Butyrivibrio sp. WCD3002 TaxID=1280676 RepID=UPI0004060127|nr:Ig-like domain-containing protein [Butyrivibrio sp. WCD3002]